MKKREWIVLAVTAIVVAALLMPKDTVILYSTAPIVLRTIEETIEATGVIAPRETFVAAPVTAGKLRLLVKSGEKVEIGQALFEIDNAPADIVKKMERILSEKDAEDAELSRAEFYRANMITSPINAVVQDCYASDEQTVTLGTPVLSLRSQEQLLQFSVSQSRRESLHLGQKVRASRRGRKYTGTIEEITLSDNGQYVVKAALPGASALSAGVQMDVSVLLGSVTAPCVPLEAIREGKKLYCLTEEGVAEVQVKTSLCDELYMALTMGPPIGTQVVLGELS